MLCSVTFRGKRGRGRSDYLNWKKSQNIRTTTTTTIIHSLNLAWICWTDIWSIIYNNTVHLIVVGIVNPYTHTLFPYNKVTITIRKSPNQRYSCEIEINAVNIQEPPAELLAVFFPQHLFYCGCLDNNIVRVIFTYIQYIICMWYFFCLF